MKVAALIAAALAGTALGGPVLLVDFGGSFRFNGDFASMSIGEGAFALLRRDATLFSRPGFSSVNSLPADQYLAVSCGGENEDLEWVTAIRSDGTLVASGWWIHLFPPPPPGQFVAVSTGAKHAIALRSDGTLANWGETVPGPTPTGTFKAISAGARYGLAIRTDGTLVYWGNGFAGLGAVPPGEFIAVSAGELHALALRTDGTLAAWGSDAYLNGILNPPPGTFRAVAAGYSFDAAIRSDGTAVIWGSGFNGGPLPPAPAGRFLDVRANSRSVLLLEDRCYANCDQSTTAPVLNVADFACFLTQFAEGRNGANCDNSLSTPQLNVQDFACYLNQFAAGCAK